MSMALEVLVAIWVAQPSCATKTASFADLSGLRSAKLAVLVAIVPAQPYGLRVSGLGFRPSGFGLRVSTALGFRP